MAQNRSSVQKIKIKRALISVSDKTGIEDFARALADFGVEILSTGGTAALLKEAGINVRDVSGHTGFPEIMDGRIKTLHPKIHGGLLARRDNETHRQAMEQQDISPIDLVVVNLYPFARTVRENNNSETCIENIDIGGPAMIRAAAKNHDFVTVVTHPEDYEGVLEDIRHNDGAVSSALRQDMAAKAFALTAAYDSDIARWFQTQTGKTGPRHISFSGARILTLRYGENPHQSAALYRDSLSQRPGVASAEQLQGKALSYNNLNDTDAAYELVAEFEGPAVAIIKHANPCGVAVAKTLYEAYERALRCDPVSAFGGIIAMNRPVDGKTARAITERFVEVVIAPSFEPGALEVFKKKDKIRVLAAGALPDPAQPRRKMTCIAGGFLVQDCDIKNITKSDLKVVTKRKPTEIELQDMIFAFRVAKHVKSNAIVYAKDMATAGIGAGQMSRIDSARIASWKARDAAHAAGLKESLARGAVVASDAFFPFADGLISAAEAGVTAVIQPGGSIRDEEVIKAADERDLAMVFTGTRHFRH